jgi:hypothetical protein
MNRDNGVNGFWIPLIYGGLFGAAIGIILYVIWWRYL